MRVNRFIDRTNDFRQDIEEKVVISPNNRQVLMTMTGMLRERLLCPAQVDSGLESCDGSLQGRTRIDKRQQTQDIR